MCGIGGIFNASAQERVDPQLLVNMAAIQEHRGPDGFGYRVIDTAGWGSATHGSPSSTSMNHEPANRS